MNIAIIGTGNVGGALATRWAGAGHNIILGVQDLNTFKGRSLTAIQGIRAAAVAEAVQEASVILLAIPPSAIFDVLAVAGELSGKTVIDATNAVSKTPDPYKTVFHCVADRSKAMVVKCFNSTGFENMLNPVYEGKGIDIFMAGDNAEAKAIATQLALDAGFGSCIDFGKADKVELLEKFALSWINLAIMQGMGRDIAFRLVKR